MLLTDGQHSLLQVSNGANAEEKYTAILMACRNGHLSILNFLLVDFGADINEAPTSRVGWCPLKWACHKGDPIIVSTLLEHGADPNGNKNESLWSPLHIVCHKGDMECTKELLNHGADINGKCDGEKTPLHIASYMGECACVQELLHFGADTHVRDGGGRTPLELAQKEGHELVVRTLSKHSNWVDAL